MQSLAQTPGSFPTAIYPSIAQDHAQAPAAAKHANPRSDKSFCLHRAKRARIPPSPGSGRSRSVSPFSKQSKPVLPDCASFARLFCWWHDSQRVLQINRQTFLPFRSWFTWTMSTEKKGSLARESLRESLAVASRGTSLHFHANSSLHPVSALGIMFLLCDSAVAVRYLSAVNSTRGRLVKRE